MDKDKWWENLKLIIRETRENINKINAGSGDRTVFFDHDELSDFHTFKDTEAYKKLKEYEQDLRSHISIPSEQRIISLINPTDTRSLRQNDHKNELVDYIFNNISQGLSERSHMMKLLADIKSQLNNITDFNETERKRLSEIETESFIKLQENKLSKDSTLNVNNNSNNNFDNLNRSIRLIEDKLKTLNEKLQNIEAQNKDIIKRLDARDEVDDYKKVNDSSVILEELHKIIDVMRVVPNKIDSTSQSHHQQQSPVFEKDIPLNKRISPNQGNNNNANSNMTSNTPLVSTQWGNPSWICKSRQQLMWEYEENKRELKLLENEGFRSPDFLRHDYLDQWDPHLNSKCTSKDKGKKARFSETEYSTEDDLTIEDLY